MVTALGRGPRIREASDGGKWYLWTVVRRASLRRQLESRGLYKAESKNICLCAKSLQSVCPTLCDTMDCSPPGSSVHGDSPDRNILEWVAISSSRESSQLRD